MGVITLVSGSHNDYPVDRLAIGRDGDLYAMSFCGNGTAVKSLFAFLNTNAKGHLEIHSDHRASMKICNSDGKVIAPKSINRLQGGYKAYRNPEPLGYGIWHCAAVTKADNFMMTVNDLSLWQMLTKPRFTTPIVPPWIPYLRKRLVAEGKLKETFGFQTRCGMIDLKNEDFDLYVQEGLRMGKIWVPDEDY